MLGGDPPTDDDTGENDWLVYTLFWRFASQQHFWLDGTWKFWALTKRGQKVSCFVLDIVTNWHGWNNPISIEDFQNIFNQNELVHVPEQVQP